ncbi:AIPR family protein [Streptomyces globisporus]|uniref:AIPR family protein n=1 Tax=Streptomyces globisporus TaxID=1908 RepID=UPI003CE75BA4
MASLHEALDERDDLDPYGDPVKRMLFAAQMAFEVEDIQALAVEHLVQVLPGEAPCLVYVDEETGKAVLAAAGTVARAGLLDADSNESPLSHVSGIASLSHLVAQALSLPGASATESELPSEVEAACRDFGDSMRTGAVQRLELWYVHSGAPSAVAQAHLRRLRHIAEPLLTGLAAALRIEDAEVSDPHLSSWYDREHSQIQVEDWVNIPCPEGGPLPQSGPGWDARSLSVSGAWLKALVTQHEEKLFSANIRGYLGRNRSASNINHGIQQTIDDRPEMFWPFNNGITALVHEIEQVKDGVLPVRGLSIINGAQTVGVISKARPEQAERIQVTARFIRCDDAQTVRDIIRYNNRQNPTLAADYRSTDPIQNRLREQFDELGVIGYNGGRRGGIEDVIRRPGENMIRATVAGQALAAFHGDPATAYHRKNAIWEDDALYAGVFHKRINAPHVIFCHSLYKAVEQRARQLYQLPTDEKTAFIEGQIGFLRGGGATWLLITALAESLDTVLGRAIPNRSELAFRKPDPEQAVKHWAPLVELGLAAAHHSLANAVSSSGRFRDEAVRTEALTAFQAMMGLFVSDHGPRCKAFAAQVSPLADNSADTTDQKDEA